MRQRIPLPIRRAGGKKNARQFVVASHCKPWGALLCCASCIAPSLQLGHPRMRARNNAVCWEERPALYGWRRRHIFYAKTRPDTARHGFAVAKRPARHGQTPFFEDLSGRMAVSGRCGSRQIKLFITTHPPDTAQTCGGHAELRQCGRARNLWEPFRRFRRRGAQVVPACVRCVSK